LSIQAGQTATAADIDAISDKADFLETPPAFVGRQTSVQSTTTGVWTALTMDTEEYDSHGGHSIVTNTSRYTCQVAGRYRVSGRAAFAANSTGSRGARITLNGAVVAGAASVNAPGSLTGNVEVNHLMALVVGDYVQIEGAQNSGGNLSTAYTSESASMLEVIWESL
jgi:hypothetical protein